MWSARVRNNGSSRFGAVSRRMKSYVFLSGSSFVFKRSGSTGLGLRDAAIRSKPCLCLRIASGSDVLSRMTSWMLLGGSTMPRWSPRLGAP